MQFVLTSPGQRGLGRVSEGAELYPRFETQQIGHVGAVLEELIGAELLTKMQLRVTVGSIKSPTQAEILYATGIVEVRVPLDGAGIKNGKRSHMRALKASALNNSIMSAKVVVDREAAAASAAEAATSATEAAASATEAAVSAAQSGANAAAAQEAARYVDDVKQ